jgi:hypothetical protein
VYSTLPIQETVIRCSESKLVFTPIRKNKRRILSYSLYEPKPEIKIIWSTIVYALATSPPNVNTILLRAFHKLHVVASQIR